MIEIAYSRLLREACFSSGDSRRVVNRAAGFSTQWVSG
jgi:hypothetical protein